MSPIEPRNLSNKFLSVQQWTQLTIANAAATLQSNLKNGISSNQASERQKHYGLNTLQEKGNKSPLRVILDQFANTLVIVLIIAAVISAVAGSLKDAIAIVAIVTLNAVLGFIQEIRAERAIAALRQLAIPKTRVRRDGIVVEISSSELVPGDIVLLEAGNLVPADGRIIESASMRIAEAMLTGESEPIEKQTETIPGKNALALGDQVNMAFMGTSVTFGRGQILVTATGMNTELGKVANLIQNVGQVITPLQHRLNRLGRILAIAAFCVVAVIFIFGLLFGHDWKLMFMTAVSMAVAVIPEGLPAVVTIALALGAQRMLHRNALIRRLPAVETLGSVSVICSDKTGTLTENRMKVSVLDLAGHRIDISEELKHRQPITIANKKTSTLINDEPSLALLLMSGSLCNDATLQIDRGRPGHYRAVGDPTEGALVIAAAHFNLLRDQLDLDFPRINEAPFDSERKRMSTMHSIVNPSAWFSTNTLNHNSKFVVFTKGAVDSLLTVCSHVLYENQVVHLDDAWRNKITATNNELARDGIRVLGIAYRLAANEESDKKLTATQLERNLIFIGLVGMLDPPRSEVKQAVATCQSAGIRPVMITGDHPVTARRIAADLNILGTGQVITGPELLGISPAQLDKLVNQVSVYARVAPEQKLRIVEALQRQGHVVAMTGDGVNDAPALRRADIGVAMGITGTDVAKEAAAMVLVDDNFATIVAAVEEGRSINDNIRRFLKFSLAGNLAKLLLVFVGPLLGMPLPLTPFQILWLNLVTDGVLGLGIGVEPSEPDVMQRKPQKSSEGILAHGLGIQIIWQGLLMGIVSIAVGWWAFSTKQPQWQTLVLTTVVLLQIFQAHASRSSQQSVFKQNPFSNKPLLGATLLLIILQAAVIYISPLHNIFATLSMSAKQVGISFLAGLVVLIVVEIFKSLINYRKIKKKSNNFLNAAIE
ncbi:MAG: cation-translocating P-type ATPase [Deltaproteobacteria bacterium]|nr:cation-translocating P-type ATPase [Deltaproteobacteria bacterium]